MSGDTQLRVWTPLVIEPMGISLSGRSGQMARHIFRDTWPCSLLTPLVVCARRMARTVMQNGSLGSRGFCRPRPRKSLRSILSCGEDRREVIVDELRGEDVVAGRHRSMRGEAIARRHSFAGGGEIETVLFHQDADALDAAERRNGPHSCGRPSAACPGRRARMPPMPRIIS